MSNDARIAVLETTIVNINSTLLDIRQDIRSLSDKTSHDIKDLSDRTSHDIKDLSDKTSRDIKDLSNKIDNLQNRLWSNFFWLMGMIIGLAGLIAHTQDWI